MKTYIKAMFFSAASFVLASPAMAATKADVNTSRIAEDAVWAGVFVILFMFALTMYGVTKSGMKNVSYGYMTLLASSITGFIWKFLGVLKRGFSMNDPEWLFEVTREIFEGITGLLFAVAFIILFVSITKKK